MKKAYHYLYYKLYNFAVSVSDDALNEWKPFITISILEILLMFEILVWYSVITKEIVVIDNPLVAFLPIATIIGIANYYFFLNKHKWKNYVEEFRQYNKRRKTYGGIAVFLVISLIIASVILSFYQMSQIDWKLYR